MIVGANKYRIGQKVTIGGYHQDVAKVIDVRIKTKNRVRYIQYKLELLGYYTPEWYKSDNVKWWFYESEIGEYELRHKVNSFLSRLFSRD